MKRFVLMAIAASLVLPACGLINKNPDKWLAVYEKVADAYIASIQAGKPDEKLAREYQKLSEEGAVMVGDLQERDQEAAMKFQQKYEEISLKALMTSFGSVYEQQNSMPESELDQNLP